MLKKKAQQDEEKRTKQRKTLLDMYGGEEHMKAAPVKQSMVTENEKYIEYDKDGGIKGAPKIKPKSKYKGGSIRFSIHPVFLSLRLSIRRSELAFSKVSLRKSVLFFSGSRRLPLPLFLNWTIYDYKSLKPQCPMSTLIIYERTPPS